jgi:AcrR family transcriptional regulator
MTQPKTNSTRIRAGANRKRRMASEDRRRQILAVAADLFSARGYAGTTTKQIAEAAGVSEPIVFRLFATKEELYTAILEDRRPREGLEEWLAELRAIADRKDDESLFCAVAAGILRSYREDPVSHRLMLYAALESHKLGSVLQLKYMMPVVSFLREYVSRRQAEGAFRPISPDMVAAGVTAVAAHIAQWSGFGLNPLGLTDDDVIAFSRLFFVGLRAEKPDE